MFTSLSLQHPLKTGVWCYVEEETWSFCSPEPGSLVAGKGHCGRPALSGKVTGIPIIRFQILVHYPKNDQKSTFSTLRLLGKAPVVVYIIDSCPELSGKVATIPHIGYQIQIARLKICQKRSFCALRSLRSGESSHQEIRKLLIGEELGDRRPSELLRVMRRRAESHSVPDDLMLELFQQHLPTRFHSCSYKPADIGESCRSSRSSHGGDANCVHYIETNSRPVTAKARRLAPDRLRIAKRNLRT
ncbi:hypothetical protein TNCV_5087931 [Trichonephila clavipes]|nr:hypothetical protein TNCV_5087931 [Trichonephila clavipes]